jgi:tRNA threonylcarbamoyladenosine biosynthesis protein TsaE
VVLISRSADRTEQFGRLVGSLLHRGDFLALRGSLGGGKTCFTRGVVATLAPESAHLVASPTFAIMNEYPGSVPVYHFDFYRLCNSDEIAELGFEDYFRGNGVCIAEWSERLENTIPDDHLNITFEHAGEDNRRISLQAFGRDSQALLARLTEQLGPEDFL